MGLDILVNGGGVVGLRVARALLAAGYKTDIAMNSLRQENARTKQLKKLVEDFPKLYVLATPTQPEITKQQGKSQDIFIDDVVSEDTIKKYDLIIDCAHKEGTRINHELLYSKHPDIPVILQGASDFDLYKNDFVCEPNTVGFTSSRNFIFKPCRKTSCNATYSSAMLGLVLERFHPDVVKSATINLYRRHQDPEDTRPEIELPTEIQVATKHAKDIERCIPELEGKILTCANKNPWRHFHRVEAVIEFEKEITGYDVEQIKETFKNYTRCLYLDYDFEAKDPEVMNKITNKFIDFFEQAGIPDGDCHLPIYSVRHAGRNRIVVTGYNPQRSVVVLNHVDYTHMMQGDDVQTAWEKTNLLPVIYGHTPAWVKYAFESHFNK